MGCTYKSTTIQISVCHPESPVDFDADFTWAYKLVSKYWIKWNQYFMTSILRSCFFLICFHCSSFHFILIFYDPVGDLKDQYSPCLKFREIALVDVIYDVPAIAQHVKMWKWINRNWIIYNVNSVNLELFFFIQLSLASSVKRQFITAITRDNFALTVKNSFEDFPSYSN